MKKIAIAVALALTTVAPNVFAEDDPGMTYNYGGAITRQQAQDLYDQGYAYEYRGERYRGEPNREYRYRDDRYRDDRYRENRWRREGYECWNPRARHFEGLREGERQDDLDMSRCRPSR